MPIITKEMSPNTPAIIAGPCAAESQEMVLQLAQELGGLGVHALRASLFKPRTEPGFEGVGYDIGGDWLREVQRQHDISVATEVTTGSDVKSLVNKLSSNRSDSQLIVWLGARMQVHTLQQEIGQALRDSPKNTLLVVKNQAWGSQKHWEGIVKHVAHGGQFSQEELEKRVILCHRGFAPYGLANPENWRNVPDFDMAMKVKQQTGLKMILDPSHIGGTRPNVLKIMRQAIYDPNIRFDGFIVEVHTEPTKALTDAEQQLSVPEFSDLLEEIKNART
jgi:3-deoxy-D-arabino-heptulosonate 7-phosphate (DAHP) synthase